MTAIAQISATILLHGVAFAMVLYLVSVGLGITMGLMNYVNLAHGAFAAVGGYAAVVVTGRLGWSFWAALPMAFVAAAAIGLVLERLVIRYLYGADELRQVLLSIGLLFMGSAGFSLLFGPVPQHVVTSPMLAGRIGFAGVEFPAYRVFVILAGGLSLAAISGVIDHTCVGMRIRAAVDNRQMAEAIGVDTSALFALTFAFGSGIAGLGGAIGADLLAINPTYGQEYLVLFLIVIAVGGLGTVTGPFLAALLIGIADVTGKYLLPEAGSFLIYALVIVLLIVRPMGLAGKRA